MKVVLFRCLRSGSFSLSAALGALLLLSGCGENDVRIYEVPTERIVQSIEPSVSNVEATEPPSGGSGELRWVVPSSWETLPVGMMRMANYRSSTGLDISVSKFPGDVGGDLANINRWRQQLSMAPVSSLEEVEGLMAYEVSVGAGKLLRLRPSGSPTASSVDVFWMSYQGETWFFKISGTSEALDQSWSELNGWLESISTS